MHRQAASRYNVGIATVLSLLMLAACEPSAPPTTEAVAVRPATETAADATSRGEMVFSLDGTGYEATHFVTGENFYTRVSSQINGQVVNQNLRLTLTLFSVDLRKLSYPIVLPPQRRADGRPDPQFLMTSIGFALRDEQGDEWTATGTVELESFSSNGVLTGRFFRATLKHIDDGSNRRSLDSGRFSVALQ